MLTIGLTGSIGMGKSATARLFADEGLPVWDADAAVHRLYGPGGAAVGAVLEAFPGAAADDGSVDRAKLSALVLGNVDALAALEALVHPLVAEDRARFLRDARSALVVLDIPLLAESGAADQFDYVVVCTADLGVRRARVLERPQMSEAKLDAILAHQASEDERLALADFIVRTDGGIADARTAVRQIIATIAEKHGLSLGPEQTDP